MIRPEQQKPNQRSKVTTTIITPHGHSFEMCIDKDECDVTDEVAASLKIIDDMFESYIDSFFVKP